MKIHKPSTFIFFKVTAGSHELGKDVVKNKIKTMKELIQNYKLQ